MVPASKATLKFLQCPTAALHVHGIAAQVAGAEGESVVLPQWGPDGSLFFVSGLPGRHTVRAAPPGLPLRRSGLHPVPPMPGTASYGAQPLHVRLRQPLRAALRAGGFLTGAPAHPACPADAPDGWWNLKVQKPGGQVRLVSAHNRGSAAQTPTHPRPHGGYLERWGDPRALGRPVL